MPLIYTRENSFKLRLGPEERKLPVLVWADYGRDVAGEVIAAAHARSVAGITRVIMATPAEKVRAFDIYIFKFSFVLFSC